MKIIAEYSDREEANKIEAILNEKGIPFFTETIEKEGCDFIRITVADELSRYMIGQ